MRVGFGIPDFVIEAVEDAAEFSVVHTEDALEAHAEMTMTDFVCVSWRDGGDKIGIHDTAFHQVDSTVAVVVSQAITGENMGWVQTNLAEDVFTMDALMSQVVQGEADSRVAHAKMLINFVKEDGNECGLPIMTMDDVGMLV